MKSFINSPIVPSYNFLMDHQGDNRVIHYELWAQSSNKP
jgi:hypothetical protein